MRQIFGSLVTALAVVVLPQWLSAQQDGGRPDWRRQDAKADQSAPKNGKFRARPDGKFADGKFEGRREHGQRDGVKSDGPKAGGFARAIFDRLDTNHDGVLSFQEFAAGLRHLHNFIVMHLPKPAANRPSGDRYQQFAGKHVDGVKRPEGPGFAEGRPWRQESPGFAAGRSCVQEHHVVLVERTWHQDGREFSESWRHEYRESGESRPWQRDGREFGEAHHARPEGRVTAPVSTRHNFGKTAACPVTGKPECKKLEAKKPEAKCCKLTDGKKSEAKCCKLTDGKKPEAKCCKLAECKKPEAKCCKLAECKKPECKKPLASSGSVTAPASGRSLEARVASLEKQQAEILGLLRNIVKSDHRDRN